eukprot:TRINITY_DN8107_c0_g3_i1.p1 TRINITY_DN8107_c0_g3~~TRINITY_DN8107_c0_g3_i1.p1  ORF type:complete len:322 (+),score=73.39 TRINITY_DN8107_c0_g3_i1:90-1055(+)
MSDNQKQQLHQLIQKLRSAHHITAQEEELLRSSFRSLEADLDIQKRRVHHRIAVASQWQSEQTELRSELEQTKLEVLKLEDQVDKKLKQVKRLQQELKASENAINQYKEQCQQLSNDYSELEAEWNHLATCELVSSSNVDLLDHLQHSLEVASASIDILVHSFTSTKTAELLAHSAKRGVVVRVLYDAAWLDAVLAGGATSVGRANWIKIIKKWKRANLHHAGYQEQGASRGRRHAFRHNLVLVDRKTLISGSFLFSDQHGSDAGTSMTIVTAQSSRESPFINQATMLFESRWEQRVEPRFPAEFTTIKLPSIGSRTTTIV